MIAPIFLLLMLAIFELGYMVFVQSVLDGSARDAARLIRTGQAQANSNPQQDFQTQMCNEMAQFVGCSSLIYEVQVFTSWSSLNSSLTQPKRGTWTSNNFSAGTACQIVAVQVTYNRSFITSWVASYLGGGTGTAFLTSTVVFQNEPFPPAPSTCG